MKQLATTLLLTALMLVGYNVGAQNSKKQTDKSMKDKKTLVAYFSWSGNTAEAAKYIAKETGADMFEIVREDAYPTDYKACTEEGKAEKERGDRPAIKGEVKGMEQYDVVFIGVPVWWYTAPMPVFTFIEQYDLSGKTVIPFCTAYTAEYQTLKDIVKATPNSTHLDGLTLITKELEGKGMDKHHAKIDKWLKKLGY